MAIYRIAEVADHKNRYKININAIQNRLVGLCLILDKTTLLIVEGCGKSHTRYHKLLTRRIEWDSNEKNKNDKCDLIWYGVVKAPSFKEFKMYTDLSKAEMIKILQKHNMLQNWI